jgi:putative ABC transport system permease protein
MRIAMITAEAVDSLSSNMRRALLAAVGLLVGVASVACVISAGQVLQNLIVREMGSFGRPTHMSINTNWRYLSSIGWTKNPESMTEADIESIAAMTDLVSGISPVSQLKLTTSYSGKSSVTNVMCVSSDYLRMERLVLTRGRLFNPEDDRTLRRAGIIGANLAEKYFGKEGAAGSVDPIGQLIKVGTFGEIEVIGVLEREGASLFAAIDSYDSTNNGTLFVPFSATRRFAGSSEIRRVLAASVSPERTDEAKGAIISNLNMRHGTWDGEPKFQISTGKDALSQVTKMTGLVTTFVSAVAGISLIVAGIGVMNVMLISMKERTREIGTRKALGARGGWIGSQFFVESMIVCLSGGFAGVLLATLVAALASRFSPWKATIPAGTVPLSMLLSTLVAVVFGWLPARRASKLDPVEALRYE